MQNCSNDATMSFYIIVISCGATPITDFRSVKSTMLVGVLLVVICPHNRCFFFLLILYLGEGIIKNIAFISVIRDTIKYNTLYI